MHEPYRVWEEAKATAWVAPTYSGCEARAPVEHGIGFQLAVFLLFFRFASHTSMPPYFERHL